MTSTLINIHLFLSMDVYGNRCKNDNIITVQYSEPLLTLNFINFIAATLN